MSTSNVSGPELEGVHFDDLGPRRIFVFHDPREGLRAVVVIDAIRHGPSGGGVRLQSHLTVAEIARLSRAMTYKYALLSLPVGGAKAGIWFDPADPARDRVVAAFVRAIEPLVASGAFVPGPDMGTRADDFAALSGVSSGSSASAVDERLTGYGVVCAAAAACEHAGRALQGCRVVLEGFGKVGAAAAEQFAREGARVVAVSTVLGAVHHPDGLDVDALLELRDAHGDELVQRMEHVQRLPREAIFALPCDVLVPGARPDVLHARNVGAVQASIVVPASNIPYAAGAHEALHARGVVALPDFVTNAGGVLAVVCAMQGFDEATSQAVVRGAIQANVQRVLARADERGDRPHDAAVALARQQIDSESR